jgi:hypothetical protein
MKKLLQLPKNQNYFHIKSFILFFKKTRTLLKTEQTRLTDLGAAGYGIMFGNLVYLLTVLCFTFYFLRNIDVRANYSISCLVGAALSSFLSTSRKKKSE